MKVIFIVIGVVVIFGILISSGGLSGELCVNGVGCIRTEDGGVQVARDDNPVRASTNRP